MKYISIDIETGGLNRKRHSIIQFAAIIEDTEKLLSFEEIPKLELLIEQETYKGTAFAFNMHQKLFEELSKKKEDRSMPSCRTEELSHLFYMWLRDNGIKPIILTDYGFELEGPMKITVAGKNFETFDKEFLSNQIPGWSNSIQYNHRFINPATMYWKPLTDTDLPSLSECKKRAGLSDTTVSHTALQDAWDVIQVLRAKYNQF